MPRELGKSGLRVSQNLGFCRRLGSTVSSLLTAYGFLCTRTTTACLTYRRNVLKSLSNGVLEARTPARLLPEVNTHALSTPTHT
ncbi:hypothetical protein GALMADRAFT_253702 [Galerina marginata CBS 339.88]|uniref:Uncharacterized protein n=1 Tax=Galerina marginata (strain CBS 339.88) TaxID=685588 RepID=A0A067SLZ6_GALM3|nr:hypothetical protein GALMADRAFT_253702 [Galerina marginata CBS 339.88]